MDIYRRLVPFLPTSKPLGNFNIRKDLKQIIKHHHIYPLYRLWKSFTSEHADLAAKYGHLDLIQAFQQMGIHCTYNGVFDAASYHRFYILDYLAEHQGLILAMEDMYLLYPMVKLSEETSFLPLCIHRRHLVQYNCLSELQHAYPAEFIPFFDFQVIITASIYWSKYEIFDYYWQASKNRFLYRRSGEIEQQIMLKGDLYFIRTLLSDERPYHQLTFENLCDLTIKGHRGIIQMYSSSLVHLTKQQYDSLKLIALSFGHWKLFQYYHGIHQPFILTTSRLQSIIVHSPSIWFLEHLIHTIPKTITYQQEYEIMKTAIVHEQTSTVLYLHLIAQFPLKKFLQFQISLVTSPFCKTLLLENVRA